MKCHKYGIYSNFARSHTKADRLEWAERVVCMKLERLYVVSTHVCVRRLVGL